MVDPDHLIEVDSSAEENTESEAETEEERNVLKLLKKLRNAGKARGEHSVRDEVYYQASDSQHSFYGEVQAAELPKQLGVAVFTVEDLKPTFPDTPTFARVKTDMISIIEPRLLILRQDEYVEVLTPNYKDEEVWLVRRTLAPNETALYQRENLVLLTPWLAPADKVYYLEPSNPPISTFYGV